MSMGTGDRAAHEGSERSMQRLVRVVGRMFAVQGLLILTVLLVVVFTFLLPDTFFTALNARAILSQKSVTALVSLALMIPVATGNFDLSVGFGIGLSHILVIGLQVHMGVPWPLAVAIVCAIGLLIGLINGLLVEFGHIDSFIATLATGTILYGISNWYTSGQQIIGALPAGFVAINGASVAGIPAPAFYVLAAAVVLWIAFEYLPVGRYLYAIGANPRAAELSGIPRRRFVIAAFMASGLLVSLAGVMLASQLQVGQSSIGPEYLLPAFVGVFLGSTTVHPGRVNVWGTIVAVLILAVGISGIQQLGSSFFVEPLFNGATLIVAVGLAGYAARRRVRSRATRDEKGR